MKKNKNKGFTLMEIIVVLVIMGILLAIAVPSVLGYVKKAKEEANIQSARVMYLNAQELILKRNINHTLNDQNDVNEIIIELTDDEENNNFDGYEVVQPQLFIDDKAYGTGVDTTKSKHTLTKMGIILTPAKEDPASDYSNCKFILIESNKQTRFFENYKDYTAAISK